jgi:hypothetical protein
MGKDNKHFVLMLLLTGLFMVVLPYVTGCSSSNDPSYVTVGAASHDTTEGTTVAVAVYRANATVPDATVSVNDRVLSYGYPVTYQNTTNTIPIYYGSVAGLPGDTLNLRVTRGGALIYSASSVIPGTVSFSNPTAGQALPRRDVAAQWNLAANAAGYWVDYVGANDAYYGAFTTGTSWTIPGGSLQSGEARFSVTALSDNLGLANGTTQTSQNDTTQPVTTDDTDSMSEISKWVSFTGNEITAQVGETTVNTPEASESLQVASVSYITKEGQRIKLNQYAPIQSPATGNITFHLRFERYTVAIGSVTLVDGQTGQTKYEWSKARIYQSERKKYGFTIPARQGDVLVIGERKVDTIWGPSFNY